MQVMLHAFLSVWSMNRKKSKWLNKFLVTFVGCDRMNTYIWNVFVHRKDNSVKTKTKIESKYLYLYYYYVSFYYYYEYARSTVGPGRAKEKKKKKHRKHIIRYDFGRIYILCSSSFGILVRDWMHVCLKSWYYVHYNSSGILYTIQDSHRASKKIWTI